MKFGSIEGDLTVEDAADILNVSVDYVVGLLDRGELPCRDAEARRRINASDLLVYKKRADSEQRKMLDELATEAEKHGLGY